MPDEMKTEAMELCVTACEKFSNNNEVCQYYNLITIHAVDVNNYELCAYWLYQHILYLVNANLRSYRLH